MSPTKHFSNRFAIECISLLIIFALTANVLSAGIDKIVPPIISIKKISPKPSVFRNFSLKDPIVIKTAEEALKYFSESNAKLLSAQVDFEKQLVLVFAWRGSGGDRLSYTVAESYPEQVSFKYKRGRTKDLRPHLYIYALRNKVTWKL